MTVTKTLLRKSFLMGAHYSGLSALASPVLKGVGGILMLHRVGPMKGDLFMNGFLSVTPEFLDEMFLGLRSDGYVICSMDEVLERLTAGHTDERFLAVTLDDGYRDNLVCAKPVFEAHNIPYTIYVCPGFVEGTASLWWEDLANVIERQERITFATKDGPGALDCRTRTEKRTAFHQLQTYLTTEVDEYTQRQFMDQLCRAYGVDSRAYVQEQVMDWDELRQIASSPLCTLGAHTMNHYHLARIARDDAAFEMEQSARVIELETGTRPQHVAFPYGHDVAAGIRETEIARELGFATAVTTRHGMLFSSHINTPHCLPRISVNGNYQRLAYMRSLLSGVAVPLANGGKRHITV